MSTGDHASCDHTATTDGDRPAQSAAPDDKASWTAGTRDPSGGRPAYLIDHGAAVEEIGRLRWALNQVVTLADDAPGLTDERLRDQLLALADQIHSRRQ